MTVDMIAKEDLSISTSHNSIGRNDFAKSRMLKKQGIVKRKEPAPIKTSLYFFNFKVSTHIFFHT